MTDKEYLDIYDRMVHSVAFGSHPSTLPITGTKLPNSSNLLLISGIAMLFVGWKMVKQATA